MKQFQNCNQEIQALCKLGKQKVLDARQWERNDGGHPPKTCCAQWYPEDSFLPWAEVHATMGREAEAVTFRQLSSNMELCL